ncbi:MAG: hypothetical protein WC525_08325 [Candidatus Thermoplasmatota archaeon]
MAASKRICNGEMYEIMLPYHLGFRWRRKLKNNYTPQEKQTDVLMRRNLLTPLSQQRRKRKNIKSMVRFFRQSTKNIRFFFRLLNLKDPPFSIVIIAELEP